MRSESFDVVCRTEVLHFGQVPIYPWLQSVYSFDDLLEAKQLLCSNSYKIEGSGGCGA